MTGAAVRAGTFAHEADPASSNPADRVQARIFLSLLEREFERVTERIGFAERCAADEHRNGFPVSAQRFEDEAHTLWATLADLHRMVTTLRGFVGRD